MNKNDYQSALGKILLPTLFFLCFSISTIYAYSSEITFIECDNVTDGGLIGYDQSVCNTGETPSILINLELPSGGSGQIEYIWIFTQNDPADGTTNWLIIPGSTDEFYAPGPIDQTTWFRRCSRRTGCEDFVVESNWVEICVDLAAPHFLYLPESYQVDCNEDPFFDQPTYEDDCSNGVEIFEETDVFQEGCTTIYTRIWTIQDACGKQNSTTQSVIAEDNSPPEITLNSPYQNVMSGDTLTFDCELGVFFSEDDVMVTDNCDSSPTIVFSDDFSTETDCSHGYIQYMECSWTATDNCGNVSVLSIYIYVVDNAAPIFTFIPPDMTIDCDSNPLFGNPEYYDECDNNPNIEFYDDFYEEGCDVHYTRTWVLYDACGNESSASQTLTAGDNESPVITLIPPYQNVASGDTLIFNCELGVFFSEMDVIVSDDCDQTPTVQFTDDFTSDADCSNGGYIQYMECSWTATDNCGNVTVLSIFIYVIDDSAPVFTYVPEDMTIECEADPVFGVPIYFDACDPNPSLEYHDETSVDGCSISYTRTWILSDDCGNESYASQTLTAGDNEAPVITLLDPYAYVNNGDTLYTDCSNIIFLDVSNVLVTDDCDVNATVTFYDDFNSGINCDEDDAPANAICTWTATDACGNVSTFTIYVIMVDQTAPYFTYVPEDINYPCGEEPTLEEAIFYDHCDNDVQVEYDLKVLGEDCDKQYIRTWKLTDHCGNMAVESQTISFIDNVPPVILQLNEVIGDDCYSDFIIQNPTVFDNCDSNPEITYTVDTVYSSGFIDLKINWTIIDHCGNGTSTFQPVTLECEDNFTFTHFDAAMFARNRVSLNWQIENDELGGHYIIETSKNGVDFEINTDYIQVRVVDYMGDNTYSKIIDLPYTGASYYQIRYLHTNGTSELSSMEELADFEAENEALIYPNPFTSEVYLELADTREETILITIYDVLGIQVQQYEMTSEMTKVSFQLRALHPGSYYVHYKIRNRSYVAPLIKVIN